MATPHDPLLGSFVRPEDSGRDDSESSKAWSRRSGAWVVLATVSCIAVLATTTFRSYRPVVLQEPIRVTHVRSTTGDLGMRGELASYLHRTSFHFQPEKNWMNDPNGPVFYKGWYHLFYQYNPSGCVWDYDLAWGHAVSKDLVHWLYLENALEPDQWYDSMGVWSGSITLNDDGVPIIYYTGSSNDLEQTQNMAIPADPSDPFLRKWVKNSQNPMLYHPPGIGTTDFRDPTTAWKDESGETWLMTIGARDTKDQSGLALLYKSKDLVHWEPHENKILHSVQETGMWECIDFYPVAVQGRQGLATYSASPSVKYVLKASLDDVKHDYYALGEYNVHTNKFTADNPDLDCGKGKGLRYDYGKFYASKTFYDPEKERRILWGWVNESDSEDIDRAKGWSSVQAIPRMVYYDIKTSSLIQTPVEEVESLRGAHVSLPAMELAPGAVVEVSGATGGQLDVELVFDFPNVANLTRDAGITDDHFDCNQGGAAHRGLFGPFGLLVLADDNRTEQTAVFFYVSYSKESGEWKTRFCSDQTRSSLLPDVDTTVFGSYVDVVPSEDFLSLRVLVDRSIVESFVQGGRTVITSRVYPTIAGDQGAHLYLFNNATTGMHLRSFTAWQMMSVPMHAI